MTYTEIEIPPDKSPEDYTYQQRRSEILDLIIEAGHPDMVSRTELANYYGVVPSTITKDIQKIRDELAGELHRDAEFVTDTFYRKALREKIRNDEYMEADTLLRHWNEWLFETGKLKRAEDREEESLDITEQWTENLAEQDPDAVLGALDDETDAEAGAESERDAEAVADAE